jgi:N-acetylneuraminate synthase/N,N'-diacetyllegionaminate synthase
VTRSTDVRIAGRAVGSDAPVFVIAEAGVNHNGDLVLARKLIAAAAAAGADAVKFQTFKADRVAAVTAPLAAYQKANLTAASSQLELLRQLELPPAAHEELQAVAREHDLLFLSTPFDESSVDLLDTLDVPAFKVPSGEVTNWPLLRHVASKGKPVILSTGMSDLQEVAAAVDVLRRSGCAELIVLHCVSNYPANPSHVNLRAMAAIRNRCDVPVGYSDHTPGVEVALAAVALGACVIEKHFTLDRELPGPDHRASLEPGELRALVAGIRIVECALGNGEKRPAASELPTRDVVRRSLVAAKPLPAGVLLETSMLHSLRPAGGIPPSDLASVVGRRLTRDVQEGEPLHWSDVE